MTAILAAAALYATLPTWAQPTAAETLTGKATFYAPGVMADVATNRELIDHPDEYAGWLAENGLVGGVALNRAGDLGRLVWLAGPDGLEGPYIVLDCAQKKHYVGRLEAGRVVEVDAATAARWAMRGPVDTVVWFDVPAWAEGVR